ncbi:hypothetical protein GQ44DRAFT_723439 [Phaeosphaeriaceae sp. PMI808]|nr:hypothetical protein GQ44DRAFT_723439 [Phaeosphaeriaceae sp. PMI808]
MAPTLKTKPPRPKSGQQSGTARHKGNSISKSKGKGKDKTIAKANKHQPSSSTATKYSINQDALEDSAGVKTESTHTNHELDIAPEDSSVQNEEGFVQDYTSAYPRFAVYHDYNFFEGYPKTRVRRGTFPSFGEATTSMRAQANLYLKTYPLVKVMDKNIEFSLSPGEVHMRFFVGILRWADNQYVEEIDWDNLDAEPYYRTRPSTSPPPPPLQTHPVDTAEPEAEGEVDLGTDARSPTPPSKTYCTCSRPGDGELMIACESEDCLIEWYHFQCVGLTNAPEGEWICPTCLLDPASIRRAMAAPPTPAPAQESAARKPLQLLLKKQPPPSRAKGGIRKKGKGGKKRL